MEELILFTFAFLFCFIGRFSLYLFSKRKKKKKNKNKNGIAVEMKYLSNKFNLDAKRIDNKAFAALLSFLDSLIIAGTLSLVVWITDNLILELLLGLTVLIALIYLVNEIVGRILVKRGYGKDEL